jgi:hypothetical protein
VRWTVVLAYELAEPAEGRVPVAVDRSDEERDRLPGVAADPEASADTRWRNVRVSVRTSTETSPPS